jgi:hypothetical protein
MREISTSGLMRATRERDGLQRSAAAPSLGSTAGFDAAAERPLPAVAGALIFILLLLAGCQKHDVGIQGSRLKVLIGATTVIAPGAPPIEDSIVIISGSRIQSVGARKDVPVPQASDRTDLTGAWIVPADGSRIERGETANLVILHHRPNGIDPASASDASSRIVAGEWQVAAPK